MRINFTNIGWIDLTCTSVDELIEIMSENDVSDLHIDDWESEATTEIAESLGLLAVSYVSNEEVEALIEVCEALEKEDADMILAFDEAVGGYSDIHSLIRNANSAFWGEFESHAEFGFHYAQETTTIPEEFENYIDWHSYADDLLMDFAEANGYYFLPV